jgi:exodeoxyribonuclease VIII
MIVGWPSCTPGVYSDIPEADYHALRDPVSSSVLKLFARTPAHAFAALSEPEDDEDSIALFLGSAIHQAFLEPHRPLPNVVVKPATYPATEKHEKVKKGEIQAGHPLPWNANAKICDDWETAERAKGNRILTADEYAAIDGCRQALASQPWLKRHAMLRDSRFELSLIADVDGTLRKARIDLVPPKPSNFFVDIKTVKDGEAGPKEWPRVMAARYYHCQAAFYLETWNALHPDDQRSNFVFAAVEKSAPYAVALYHVAEAALERGRQLNAERLETFLRCRHTGVWPGYATEPMETELPPWA